jgi:hypothetical protein
MHTMKRLLIAAAALVSIGAGCAASTQVSTAPEAKRAPATRTADAIFIVEGEPVTLNGGVAEIRLSADAAVTTTTRIFGEPVSADLDGDGDMDAAVWLTRDGGGSGTFWYVAASIKEEWGYRGTEAYPIGDRIAPQTLEIHDAVIVANYAERKPGEPMTADPSVGVSKYFRVEAGELQPTEKP